MPPYPSRIVRIVAILLIGLLSGASLTGRARVPIWAAGRQPRPGERASWWAWRHGHGGQGFGLGRQHQL